MALAILAIKPNKCVEEYEHADDWPERAPHNTHEKDVAHANDCAANFFANFFEVHG